MAYVIVIFFFFLQGRGNVFFLGGDGKNVEMPSDVDMPKFRRGTGISIPLRQKVGGGGQFPPPPGSCAPVFLDHFGLSPLATDLPIPRMN